MEGERLIWTLQLKNFLSYGSKEEIITLEPLNVLIGPNSSGKSNLIEAIAILQSTPRDLMAPIREGGGIGEWLWKGGGSKPVAEINAVIDYPDGKRPLRYRLGFTQVGQRLKLVDEGVENKPCLNDSDVFYRYQSGAPFAHTRSNPGDPVGTAKNRQMNLFTDRDFDLSQSVLSQRKDPDGYPELTYIGDRFSRIRLYRECNLGPNAAPRTPQKADLPEDFLLEDASNLGLVLNDLEHQPGTKKLILEKLRAFYEPIQDITTKIHGGTVQIYVHETGLKQPIPASRLSDGALRYLCMLTVLCHPTPPPLLCIEEPELGLHPDVLSTVADLLIDASHRTQLIVTTHSDVLVSALTDVPESVLVCERDDTGSHLRRLEKDKLEEWLEKYTLGELWRMGEIGGTPW